MAASRSVAAFCPTSNLFLGSGLFDQARLVEAGVRVALATDVGGGTSYSMLRTAAEGYKVLQLNRQSWPAAQAFYRMTLGNARALGLDDRIGVDRDRQGSRSRRARFAGDAGDGAPDGDGEGRSRRGAVRADHDGRRPRRAPDLCGGRAYPRSEIFGKLACVASPATNPETPAVSLTCNSAANDGRITVTRPSLTFFAPPRPPASRFAAPFARGERAAETPLERRDEGRRAERAADRLAAPREGEGGGARSALEQVGEARRALEQRRDPDQPVVAPGKMGAHARPRPVFGARRASPARGSARHSAPRPSDAPRPWRPREPRLKEMAGLARARVDEGGVAPVRLCAAPAPGPRRPRRQDQMDVVRHLAIGSDRDAEAAAGLGEPVAIERVVAVLEETRSRRLPRWVTWCGRPGTTKRAMRAIGGA